VKTSNLTWPSLFPFNFFSNCTSRFPYGVIYGWQSIRAPLTYTVSRVLDKEKVHIPESDSSLACSVFNRCTASPNFLISPHSSCLSLRLSLLACLWRRSAVCWYLVLLITRTYPSSSLTLATNSRIQLYVCGYVPPQIRFDFWWHLSWLFLSQINNRKYRAFKCHVQVCLSNSLSSWVQLLKCLHLGFVSDELSRVLCSKSCSEVLSVAFNIFCSLMPICNSSSTLNPPELLELSSGSVVGIATAYGLDERGLVVRVPVGSSIFTSQYRPDRCWGPPSLLFDG
jgi:hypothetical protein